jgi:hypothetical protein
VGADHYPEYDGTTMPGANERTIKRDLPAGIPPNGQDESYRDRWFRATFQIGRDCATEPYAVYFPNVIQNIALCLNANLIGASGGMIRPAVLNRNMPQRFALHAHSLTPGNHTLHIRVYTGIGATGRLAPLAVGPLRVASPPKRNGIQLLSIGKCALDCAQVWYGKH